MRKKSPLKISSLQLWAYDPTSEVAKEYPASEWFDDRSDFLLSRTLSGVAVNLSFLNDRLILSDNRAGVRRRISVELFNNTYSELLTSSEILVNIPRGEFSRTIRTELPLSYDVVDTGCTYKITVRDISTDEILKERHFYFHDTSVVDLDVSQWFVPKSGGIIPSSKNKIYRSTQTCVPEVVRVQFNFLYRLNEDELHIFPEMEIRVYLPNGKVERQFVRPKCEDYDMKEYVVDMQYVVDIGNWGIAYAELTCLEYPVAGFVFNTNGHSVTEGWDGAGMQCLEEYSLQACMKHYHTQLKDMLPYDNNTEGVETLYDDDEFERCLNDFIERETNAMEAAHLADILGDEKECLILENETEKIKSSMPDTEENMFRAIESLTGLKSVKRKLEIYEKVVMFNKLRIDSGLEALPLPLHAMFLGASGTGKTTVAKRMGQMLRRAGILSNGHVVVKERANLLGPNYSNEETNTLKAIEEAQGGILFIDEAYQLYQPNDPRDPGRFVIETLMTALADESSRDWMLILAGYPEEMRRMFEMNPGLRSRIPESNIYVFEDFTESELMEIADNYLTRQDYHLSADARTALSERLSLDYARKDKTFGNARHVINMIQTDIIPAMAVRVMSEETPDISCLSEIQACDIPQDVTLIRPTRGKVGFSI